MTVSALMPTICADCAREGARGQRTALFFFSCEHAGGLRLPSGDQVPLGLGLLWAPWLLQRLSLPLCEFWRGRIERKKFEFLGEAMR